MRLPRLQPARLGAGALVIAALAVGQSMNDHLPEQHDDRAFERTGVVGQPVDLRFGTVEVTSVDGSTVTAGSYGDRIATPGVFVVVEFTFTATNERAGVSYGELRAASGDLVTFSSFGERTRIDCGMSQPSFTNDCTAVIEVASKDLAGATLALTKEFVDPRFDDMAVVDLGITKDEAREWARRTDPIVPRKSATRMESS